METKTNDDDYLDTFSPAIDRMVTDSALAYLTEDCILLAGNAEPIHWHQAIREVFDSLYNSIESIRHEITDRFSREDRVVYRGIVTYGFSGGRSLTVPFCDVIVMCGQKIAAYFIYIDWHGVWEPS